MKNTLVSIIVITYNSSLYVLDTLESAKAQTYKNIELIVSDDGSVDNTIEICRQWIKDNKERFVRTEMITVEKNTGIPANCNRGVKASEGEWIKLIAGDDLLQDNCIKNYIEFIIENNNIPKFIFSNVVIINSKSVVIDRESNDYSNGWGREFGASNVSEQYSLLLKSNKVWAPTWFFSKDVFIIANGFDERYRCFEDRPFMLNILKNGFKIYHVNIYGALYRIHTNSIQRSNKILSCFEEDRLNYFINELKSEIPTILYKKLKRRITLKKFLRRAFKNKKNILSSIIIKGSSKLNII